MNINEYRQRLFESEIRPNSKLVALCLLQYLNRKTLDCYPSMQTIALDCGLCRNSVASSIKELEENNLLSIQKRRAKNQRFSVNCYTFCIEPCPPDEQSNEQSNECSNEQSNERSPDGHKPIQPIKPIKEKKSIKRKSKISLEEWETKNGEFCYESIKDVVIKNNYSPKLVKERIRAFRNSCFAKDYKYVDFKRAFLSWHTDEDLGKTYLKSI